MGFSVPKILNVIPPSPTAIGDILNIFNQVSSVPSGSQTSVVSYTVPIGKKFFLTLCEFSGDNVASYELFIDDVLNGQKRTYFGGDLFGDFFFGSMRFIAGQSIEIKVTHDRLSLGEFEGRILGMLQDV